ncbi:PAS domain S-box protein [bacterium]|nr:PAS domain S-box protein [bacterium]
MPFSFMGGNLPYVEINLGLAAFTCLLGVIYYFTRDVLFYFILSSLLMSFALYDTFSLNVFYPVIPAIILVPLIFGVYHKARGLTVGAFLVFLVAQSLCRILFVFYPQASSRALELAHLYLLISFLIPFIAIIIDTISRSREEQKALLLLTETQGLLGERKIELEHTNRELLEANEKTSLIIETAHDAFIAIDPNGLVREWNRQAEKIFGWKKEEALGHKLSSIVIPPEFRKQLESDIKALFSDGKDPILKRQIEVTAIHRSGYLFPAEMSISVLRYGNTYSFNAFVRDITERKKAAEEIKERAEKLARSNAELEQFAYVASHDLQEPLRMVASYTQLIKKRYAEKLDKEAIEFIDFAIDGVTRMQQLIKDLLEYSRVGRKDIQLQNVSLKDTVDIAVQNLKLAIQDAKATIKIDEELPVVEGDSVQLVQLFQNLIANAVKFAKKGEPCVVEIGSEKGPNTVAVYVKDNGIGIDSQYYEKIFTIFQRLHTRAEYSGTGIGLAVCKKIMERHHGKITVESEPQKGSTFYLFFPMKG